MNPKSWTNIGGAYHYVRLIINIGDPLVFLFLFFLLSEEIKHSSMFSEFGSSSKSCKATNVYQAIQF